MHANGRMNSLLRLYNDPSSVPKTDIYGNKNHILFSASFINMRFLLSLHYFSSSRVGYATARYFPLSKPDLLSSATSLQLPTFTRVFFFFLCRLCYRTVSASSFASPLPPPTPLTATPINTSASLILNSSMDLTLLRLER